MVQVSVPPVATVPRRYAAIFMSSQGRSLIASNRTGFVLL